MTKKAATSSSRHGHKAEEAGSEDTDRTSQMTFAESTKGMKETLIALIRASQDTLDEDKVEEEERTILNNFKKGLFAKCERKKSAGQQAFIASMAELRARRELQAKREGGDKELKDRNAELLKEERQFLEHLQESKMNQKAVGRSSRLWQVAKDEAKLEEGGGAFAAKRDPEYALDDRLKVYKEVNPPPASVYVGLGCDP